MMTRGLVILLVLSLMTSQALAAPPIHEFGFQGFLKDSTGKAVTGQKHVTLRLYTIPTGGSASNSVLGGPRTCPDPALSAFCIWQENQTNIGFVNGIFTINVGNQTSLNRVDFAKALFLEIIIKNSNGGVEQVLSPRVNLTASPFALSTERGNFGYFNGTQLLINQTGTSSAKTILNITNFGSGSSLFIRSGATIKDVINITANSLTEGAIINASSSSSSPLYRNLVVINNNNTIADAAIPLKIRQAGSTYTLVINADTEGGPVTNGVGTIGALNITAGKLTTGAALNIGSSSGSTAQRTVVHIINSNTESNGATVLGLRQESGGYALGIVSKTTGDNTLMAALNITAGKLENGAALNIGSSSGDDGQRFLVNITNTNPAAIGTTVLNIIQSSTGSALAVNSFTTGTSTLGALNITAGKLTTGAALQIKSGSGDMSTRNLVNITNGNTAAVGTTVLRLNQGSTGNILNVVNASGAETLKVSGAGVTTVTQLKVNTTGVTLQGIFMGRNTTVVTLGTNTITVTGADGNDVATCTFQSGLITQNMDNKNFFVTIGNVTTDKVFVNVTYSGSGSYSRAPFPLGCIVFDIPQ